MCTQKNGWAFSGSSFPGSRIKLREMKDPYARWSRAARGLWTTSTMPASSHEVGQWQNPGADHRRGQLLCPPARAYHAEVYMPLTADLYTRNEYGEMEDDCTQLDGRMLRCYEGEILRALINNRMPEESENGIMHWYGGG